MSRSKGESIMDARGCRRCFAPTTLQFIRGRVRSGLSAATAAWQAVVELRMVVQALANRSVWAWMSSCWTLPHGIIPLVLHLVETLLRALVVPFGGSRVKLRQRSRPSASGSLNMTASFRSTSPQVRHNRAAGDGNPARLPHAHRAPNKNCSGPRSRAGSGEDGVSKKPAPCRCSAPTPTDPAGTGARRQRRAPQPNGMRDAPEHTVRGPGRHTGFGRSASAFVTARRLAPAEL